MDTSARTSMGTSTGVPDEPVYAWTANGHRLHVDLADERAHALVAADGDLNPLSLLLWQRALDPHEWAVVVDVGVNYGEMLIGVDLPTGARVIGFEPNPTVRALVARSLTEAGLEVDLRAEAVAERTGTARFELDADWSGLSSLAGPEGPEGAPSGRRLVDVPVTRLDDVVPVEVASLCVKVDVEGFEEQVLAGATTSRDPHRPWVLMIEILHLAPGVLERLAGDDTLVLLRLADRVLVPHPAGQAASALASGDYYPQDALLVGPAALPLL